MHARLGAVGVALLVGVVGLPTRNVRAQAWDTWDDPGKATRAALFAQTFGHHFTLGQDAPVAWFNDVFETNNARFDAKVGYLSGGAARPDVQPAVDPPWWIKYSDFPTVTINECKNAKHPCVPWFTYYALAQSYPALYGDGIGKPNDPASATPYNAKLPATMRAYFEQFKYLMQKCAAQAPYPIVVHIEPDEWGHLLLSGAYTWPNLDPETVDVKVGSTGMPELAGFPDNEIGWARAFKKLRDTYAPNNVFLIANPSAWDGQPGHSMDGAHFGAIIKDLAGDWEGAVLETGDRDKGMAGLNPPYVATDGSPSISILGSFAAHLDWISAFHAETKLPVFIWQAAAGNTKYRSCNNSDGHYMDNLAETLLDGYPQNDMIAQYAGAGAIGWMFNAGQGGSTHVYDAKNDGITNPTAVAGNMGLMAEYADDDGGYMRLRGAAYYAAPFLFASNATDDMSGASNVDAGVSSDAATGTENDAGAGSTDAATGTSADAGMNTGAEKKSGCNVARGADTSSAGAIALAIGGLIAAARLRRRSRSIAACDSSPGM